MKTILLPTDFSDNARNAIKYALNLFGGDKSNRFILLNSYEMPHSTSQVMISVDDILEKNSIEGLEKELKTVKNLPEALGLNIETVTAHGETDVVIDLIAKKNKADFIVMGTQGASGLKEVLIGSVTASTVKNVDCPIIAVPSNLVFKAPKNIVFAADFKELKDPNCLTALVALAEHFNSKVTVLKVLKPGEITDNDEAVQCVKLNQTLSSLNHNYELVENTNVEQGINSFLNKGNVDMVAMLERKVGFFEKLFHKSITKQVASHTKLPLLVMHG